MGEADQDRGEGPVGDISTGGGCDPVGTVSGDLAAHRPLRRYHALDWAGVRRSKLHKTTGGPQPGRMSAQFADRPGVGALPPGQVFGSRSAL